MFRDLGSTHSFSFLNMPMIPGNGQLWGKLVCNLLVIDFNDLLSSQVLKLLVAQSFSSKFMREKVQLSQCTSVSQNANLFHLSVDPRGCACEPRQK